MRPGWVLLAGLASSPQTTHAQAQDLEASSEPLPAPASEAPAPRTPVEQESDVSELPEPAPKQAPDPTDRSAVASDVGVLPPVEPPHPPPETPDSGSHRPAASSAMVVQEPVTERAFAPIPRLQYSLERIDVRGNQTRPGVILGFLPLSAGETLDPNDPRLAFARLRLMGTGWFDEVTFTLERGTRRGAVVLVIEVIERNTLLIDRVVAGLSRVVNDSTSEEPSLRPYAGLGLRETNLLGLGIGISGAGVVSVAPNTGRVVQYGLDFRYSDGSLGGSDFDLRARLFHNHAREFFGRRPVITNVCLPPEPDDDDYACDPDIQGRRAVVIYDRSGAGIGSGNDIDDFLSYSFGWLGERVDVVNKSLVASTQRGLALDHREGIDFRIEDDVSYVSSLELGLTFDTRDHPATPSRGDVLRLRGRISASMLGSDYDFARLELTYRHHFSLPWGHLLQLGTFVGSVFGRAPFFYHFYSADLSDLLPSRQLELNLDHRRTHNLLGTAIREMDQEELAARVDLEYQLPILRGGAFVRSLDAYFGVGMFLLSRREDLRVAIPGYTGLARVPVDVTFDVGVVADTDYGLFRVGFSSLIGFLPDLGRGAQ
ncbi:MAG: BamA/TamA family outer membrane protein [Myxococcales bacterium]|nr:BamA/TamA family outer membrane protein [Myxococcales bacterium]MDD9968447.1 BamA/TamA family outer membrane protein [Myxococcales bacterium]